MTARPRYDELPLVGDSDVRSAWGQYGKDDELGALNLLTPARVQRAATLVREGTRYDLGIPLDQPNPPLFGRSPLTHELIAFDETMFDDKLDDFYPQASTQWDALAHMAHPTLGYYNGFDCDQIRHDKKLGIDNQARAGIVARGVLLDVGRWAERNLPNYRPDEHFLIDADILEAVRAAHDVRLEPGDALCIRTGWIRHYVELDGHDRAELAARSLEAKISVPGLAPTAAVARLVWDSGITALAVDNPTVEAMPSDTDPETLTKSVHTRVLAMQGVLLGEFFDFEQLAIACAADGRYEFMFTSAPLQIRGGIGSPPNALAIR